MPKTYLLQPHLRPSDRVILGCVMVGVTLSFMVPFWIKARYHAFWFTPIRLSFYLSFTISCLGLLAMVVGKGVRAIRYEISTEALIYDGLRRRVVMPLKDVTSLHYRSLLFWNGYGLVSAGRVTIRLPFVIENLDDLVATLRHNLEVVGKEEVFDAAALARFYDRARFHERKTHLLFSHLKPLSTVILWVMVVSGLIADGYWRFPPLVTLSWILIGMAWSMIGFLTADQLVIRAREKSNDAEPVDAQAIFVGTWFVVFLLYLVNGILFRSYYAGMF